VHDEQVRNEELSLTIHYVMRSNELASELFASQSKE